MHFDFRLNITWTKCLGEDSPCSKRFNGRIKCSFFHELLGFKFINVASFTLRFWKTSQSFFFFFFHFQIKKRHAPEWKIIFCNKNSCMTIKFFFKRLKYVHLRFNFDQFKKVTVFYRLQDLNFCLTVCWLKLLRQRW